MRSPLPAVRWRQPPVRLAHHLTHRLALRLTLRLGRFLADGLTAFGYTMAPALGPHPALDSAAAGGTRAEHAPPAWHPESHPPGAARATAAADLRALLRHR